MKCECRIRKSLTKIDYLHRGIQPRIARLVASLPFVIAMKAAGKIDVIVKMCRYFDELGIKYMVVGGMAVEGMRGKMTRVHGDVDFAFLDEQVSAAVSALRANGFDVETASAFTKEAYKRGVRVDLYEWKQRPGGMVEYMRYDTLVRIPRAFLEGTRRGHVGGVAFKFPSDEYLISMLPFMDHAADRAFVASLNVHEGIKFRQFTNEINISLHGKVFEHVSNE